MKKPGPSFADTVRVRLANNRFWHLVLAGYLSVLAFLSLNPWVRPRDTGEVFSPDKIDHALAYGGLAIVIYLCLSPPRQPRAWAFAVAGATLAGILIELAQSLFTVNRSGSAEDAVANAIGTLFGFAVYRATQRLIIKRGAA